MMGEEASKRDLVVSQHDQNIEEINDVWNTFQLPIPIPRTGEGRQTDDQKEWLLQVVDQLRLLQTMNEQFANSNNNAPYRTSLKYQRMKGQINLAFSGQARIEQTFHYPPPMTNNNSNDDTTIADEGDKQQSNFYENAHRLVQYMREETEDICSKFHEWLSRHPEQEMQLKDNVIANIFFAPLEPVATQDEPLDNFSDEGDADEAEFEEDDDLNHTEEAQVLTQKRSQPTTRRVIPTRQHQNMDIDPVEFQKQQQELLEEELSSMATQLKSSTLAMNATLQTQTKDLEGMEDIAQANLDNVSSTTKKVEQRLANNKGWKKKLATWSVIFTVVGMWILCFMIMRTVPKRKIGNVRVVSWKRFFTEKSGRLKDRLDMLLNGKSFDSHWEQSETAHEENRQRHKQQQQRQQNNQRQECAILPDGSQECRERDINDNPDARAQQFLAERKQRRIEENMANARKVDADIPDKVEAEEDENTDCIPPTPSMQGLLKALKGMTNTRIQLTKLFESSGEGPKERQSLMLKNLQSLLSDYERYVTSLERAQDAARTEYWAGKEQEAVQDKSFCTTDTDKTDFEQNQAAWTTFSEMIKAAEDRSQKVQEKEAKLQMEAEDDRLRKEAAAKRKAEEEAAIEARKRAEEEAAAAKRRAEEEAAEARKIAEKRAAAEARKKVEDEAATAKIARNKAEEEAAAAKKRAEEEATEARKKAEEEAAAEAIIREQERLVDLRKKIQIEARKAAQAAEQVESDGFRASDLRFAASKGENNLLAYYMSEMPDWIDASDVGGWRPLHEAARAGNLVGVELLVAAGCDISSRTGRSGNGGTALWWAIQRFGENHDVVELLRFHNALEAGPAS
eukprot:scaffold2304_cov147-Skeletonema_menzelii.AAC.5